MTLPVFMARTAALASLSCSGLLFIEEYCSSQSVNVRPW